VASIAALEAALPAVSPTGSTPDLTAYLNLIQAIQSTWSPLFNLNESVYAAVIASANQQ
jgi:hypothetical protein